MSSEQWRAPATLMQVLDCCQTSTLIMCCVPLHRPIAVSAALLQQCPGTACHDELHADNHQ